MMEQGADDWVRARLKGIGGSEASALYDQSPWSSQYSLWAEKTGRSPLREKVTIHNAPELWWGTALEPVVRSAYQDLSGRPVVDGVTMLHCEEAPVLFANTDGRIPGPVDGQDGDGIYEGKATVASFDDPAAWRNGPPIWYWIQIQHYMACTGLKWSSVCRFCPSSGIAVSYWDIPRHEKFIDDLRERATRWWDVHVVKDRPPKADGSRATTDAIRKSFSEQSFAVVDLGEIWTDRLERLSLVNAAIRDLKREKTALENLFQARLGHSTHGVLPNGRGVRLTEVSRKGYTAQPTTYRKFGIIKDMSRELRKKDKNE